jgi:hypothetical protein
MVSFEVGCVRVDDGGMWLEGEKELNPAADFVSG